MGKGLDKFLNIMRLNDDDYEDEYDDEYDDEYEEDYEDDYDDEPEPVVHKKKTSFRKTASSPEPERERVQERRETQTPPPSMAASSRSGARSKIVPMKQPTQRTSGMEVSIQKPATFDDSRDICDVLLTGKAAVVNLEGIDVEVAQRIIDFISGACYSMSGNIQKVSSYIFIVTPAGIDISGDMENVLTNNTAVPAFRLNV